MPELRTVAAMLNASFGAVNTAVGIRSFGFEDFRHTVFSIAAAAPFTPGTHRPLYAGVALSVDHVGLRGYANRSGLDVAAGALWEMLPNLSVGLSATHLLNPVTHPSERWPLTLALGAAFRAADAVLVAFDVEKEAAFPLVFRTGIEVRPVPLLALRTGVATEPTRWSTGAEVSVGAIHAGAAAEHHEALGWTPAVAFGVIW